MIRDPSDGSVRPQKSAPSVEPSPQGRPSGSGLKDGSDGADTVLDTTTSGLPAASAKDADRHKRSREWLDAYRAGKIALKYAYPDPKSEEQP